MSGHTFDSNTLIRAVRVCVSTIPTLNGIYRVKIHAMSRAFTADAFCSQSLMPAIQAKRMGARSVCVRVCARTNRGKSFSLARHVENHADIRVRIDSRLQTLETLIPHYLDLSFGIIFFERTILHRHIVLESI